jgi:hypothetical protein
VEWCYSDHDGDAYVDIFFVNGPLIETPSSSGRLPDKSGSAYWNRLYRNNGDGIFSDVMPRLVWPGRVTIWALQLPTMITTAIPILT